MWEQGGHRVESWGSEQCEEGQRTGAVKSAGSFSHTKPSAAADPGREWLCWIFQSPREETTNRKLAVFSFHPCCRPGCPGGLVQAPGKKGGGRDGGGSTFEKAFGKETCPGAGPQPAQSSSPARTQEPAVSMSTLGWP